jgi:hypothetical protein
MLGSKQESRFYYRDHRTGTYLEMHLPIQYFLHSVLLIVTNSSTVSVLSAIFTVDKLKI